MKPADEAQQVSPDAVLGQIKKLALENLELPENQVEDIGYETPLVGGLELDSLAQTVLLAEIEERFGFTFGALDREELQAAQTVEDLIQLVLARAKLDQP